MKKSEIETRRQGYYSPQLPAINVKVYNCDLASDDVMEKFGCERAEAEEAMRLAFDAACEAFWEEVEELAISVFNAGRYKWPIQVWAEGRSGGWLVVDGLPGLEQWDGSWVSKWSKFVRLVKEDIAYRISAEALLESIEANQWYKPGAELYNFVDTAKGPRCIADLKRDAVTAGFGPVVRP